MRCQVGIATIALFLVNPSLGAAQARLTGANLQGTVADQSGGVLIGAAIKVTSVETNVVRTTQTDADGRYSVRAFRPGSTPLRLHNPASSPRCARTSRSFWASHSVSTSR